MSFFFFQISNGYCQKSFNEFWEFLWNSATSQIYLIYTFLTIRWWPFEFFFNFRKSTFFKKSVVLQLFPNLKCSVVYYANVNSSSVNKPFLNYVSLNMLFRLFLGLFVFCFCLFFYLLFIFIFTKFFPKTLYHFSIQISKINFKM